MRELGYSILLAVAYAATAGTYIVVSSQWVSASAGSVDELAGREILKGLVFVGTTALLLGFGTYALFHRLRVAHDGLVAQREALVAADRAALAAHLASSIAHDFKNQLMVAIAAAEDLARHVQGQPKAHESLSYVREALDGATRLATDFSKLGAQSLGKEPVSVDLAGVARDSLRLIRRHPHLARCRVEQEIDPVQVRGAQPLLLTQALVNLLLNAAEATGGGGKIRLRVGLDGDAAVAEVHDDGAGVPPDLSQRIFEPFFTTKPAGTGLGLFSVRTCTERSGGTVHVAQSPLGGACFQLRFPAPPRSSTDLLSSR